MFAGRGGHRKRIGADDFFENPLDSNSNESISQGKFSTPRSAEVETGTFRALEVNTSESEVGEESENQGNNFFNSLSPSIENISIDKALCLSESDVGVGSESRVHVSSSYASSSSRARPPSGTAIP